MSSEDRKRQYRENWAKQNDKIKAKGMVRKIVVCYPDDKIVVVSQSQDKNQVDFVHSEKEKLISAAIDLLRTKNKGLLVTAKQKDLVALIQEIEGMLAI